MTTLIEAAAKTLIEVLGSEKSQNVLSMKSGRALEELEQAIAQEQEIARICKNCKSFAIRNGAACRSCDKDYSNWEPKP